jgi:hypothetical protein
MKRSLILLLALAAALAPAAFAADLTGTFDRGTRYEEPALHAPANVSRMFARELPRSAQNASVDLPAAGGSGMLIWTIPVRRNVNGAAVTTRLRTPSGAVLDRAERGSLERGLRRFRIDGSETAELGLPAGAHDVVHVMNTVAASYALDVEMPDDVAGVTVVAAEPDSAIVMRTWASPLSRQPGEPITLHAELADGATPIANARVTARLASPNGKAFDAIELTADGNGVYTATLAELPERTAGAWQVRFEADGVAANDARFARTGSGELVAERGAARLGGIRTEVVGDVLRVSVPADVNLAGAYRFDVLVADGSRNALAWGEGVRHLVTGATNLELEIPLANLGGAAVDDLFFDVRLLGLDAMGVAGRVTR